MWTALAIVLVVCAAIATLLWLVMLNNGAPRPDARPAIVAAIVLLVLAVLSAGAACATATIDATPPTSTTGRL